MHCANLEEHSCDDRNDNIEYRSRFRQWMFLILGVVQGGLCILWSKIVGILFGMSRRAPNLHIVLYMLLLAADYYYVGVGSTPLT